MALPALCHDSNCLAGYSSQVYRGLDTALEQGDYPERILGAILFFFSGHTGNVVGKAELLGSCFAGNAGRKPAQSEPQRGRSSQATEEQSLSGFFALPVFLWVSMPGSPGCHGSLLLKLINQSWHSSFHSPKKF